MSNCPHCSFGIEVRMKHQRNFIRNFYGAHCRREQRCDILVCYENAASGNGQLNASYVSLVLCHNVTERNKNNTLEVFIIRSEWYVQL